MGNSGSSSGDPGFNPYDRQYQRPGGAITPAEISCIRKNFLNFGPDSQGLISSHKVLNKYKDAYQMNGLQREFAGCQ